MGEWLQGLSETVFVRRDAIISVYTNGESAVYLGTVDGSSHHYSNYGSAADASAAAQNLVNDEL